MSHCQENLAYTRAAALVALSLRLVPPNWRADTVLSTGRVRSARVPWPLAWGRNSVRELRAQRRRVLGGGGRGLSQTVSRFRLDGRDRGTYCRLTCSFAFGVKCVFLPYARIRNYTR